MNGKITKAKKQAISADKPDLETMEKFISLLTFGCREEEVIGFGQNYEGANFRYLNLNDFQETLHKQIQWLGDLRSHCPVFSLHPLRPDYQQTTPGQAVGKKHKGTDSTRIRWVVVDIDRTRELKDAGFADGEQIKMLTHAMGELHKELTERHGFKSIPIAFSGHGFHLYLPVEFPNTKETQRTLERFIDLIAPYLGEYSQLELDKQPLLPHTAIRLPGGVNRKYEGQHTLTKVINLDDLTPEGCEQARDTNSRLIEALVVENEPELEIYNPPRELIAKGLPKGLPATGQESMNGLLKLFDDQQDQKTIQGWLEAYGYELLGKRPSGALAFRRPGKQQKGLSLLLGGGGRNNLTYGFSSSDTLIPPKIYIRPYFLKLLLEGVVSNPNGTDYSVLKPDAFKEFFGNIRRTFGNGSSNKTNTIPTPQPLAPAPPVQTDIKPETPKEEDDKGTLANIKLPGILEQIAQDIGRNNAITAPEIDRAYAITLMGLLIGKARKGPTNLPCSTYLVVLAPSSCGKDAGKAYLPRFMRAVDELYKPTDISLLNLKTYSIRGVVGSSFGSPEGLQDELLIHGRLCINGNESERFLHPSSREKACLDARDFLLDASGGKELSGRALAGGRKRPGIPKPYVNMIHTSQPASYFAAFQDDSEYKGHLGRFIHLTAGWGAVNYNHTPMEIPEDLLKAGSYWQQENLKGLERKLEQLRVKIGDEEKVCLGRFEPDGLVIGYSSTFNKRQLDYFQHCRDEARKANQAGNKALENTWSRINEQALRLTYIFTLAEDHKALEVDPKQFDLATKIMEKSLSVVACSGEDRLRVKSSKDREKVLGCLKVMTKDKDSKEWLGEGWIRKNELLKRCDKWLEDVNHLNRILFTLQDQGQLEYAEGIQGKSPGKVRLTQAN